MEILTDAILKYSYQKEGVFNKLQLNIYYEFHNPTRELIYAEMQEKDKYRETK